MTTKPKWTDLQPGDLIGTIGSQEFFLVTSISRCSYGSNPDDPIIGTNVTCLMTDCRGTRIYNTMNRIDSLVEQSLYFIMTVARDGEVIYRRSLT